MHAPFNYGTTVSDSIFTDREDELQRLKSNLTGGINTILISPRRWGKSSLVEKAVGELKADRKKRCIVLIDLFGVANEQEFLEEFARAVIQASSTNWQEWMDHAKAFLKKVIPKLTVGVDPVNDFSIGFDWKDLEKHPDEILNLAEKIAQKSGQEFIICLDEFQNLAGFKNYDQFEKKMRAIWQRQKRVTYCLFGSQQHMLTEIFSSPSKPFYKFGDIMFLTKIPTNKWVPFVVKQFKKTRKEISEENAEKIASLMENHSWYVQQLSHYIWNNTKKKVTKRNIDAGLNELLRTNLPLFQQQVRVISKTQLNLLKAIAMGEEKLTSQRVMQEYRLGTPRNVSKNKVALIAHELTHVVEGKHEFLDPVFLRWFIQQFNLKP